MNKTQLLLVEDKMQSLRATDEDRGKSIDLFLSNLPPIVERLRLRLSVLLKEIEENSSAQEIDYLRKCFSERYCPRVDYDVFGKTFARHYFLENFLKAVAVFQIRPSKGKCVLDLGCGSGATTIAYLAVLDDRLDTKLDVNVYFVDTSQRQLDLAERLFGSVREEFQHLNITSHFLRQDFQKPINPLYNLPIDTVLLGHVLNENRSRVKSLLDSVFSWVTDGSSIYVIERKNDSIWKIICKYASAMALPLDYGSIRLETIPSSSEKFLNSKQNSLDFNKTTIETSFLLINTPKKDLVRLLSLYFRAWEDQSIELLDSIFDCDALYHEKPFIKPLRGLDAIKNYWSRNVLRQKNIAIRILKVGYSSTDAFAEWETSFLQDNLKVKLKGALILILDCQTNKIASLHEYYTSKKKA